MILKDPLLPKRRRIVIAEDNLDHLRSLARLLEDMGHAVDFAINGYVAPGIVKRFRPDLVIVDLGLPGLSGFEVAAQIRKDPEVGKVRIVALTGYDEPEMRELAARSGFDAYFVKPVDPKIVQALFADVPAGR